MHLLLCNTHPPPPCLRASCPTNNPVFYIFHSKFIISAYLNVRFCISTKEIQPMLYLQLRYRFPENISLKMIEDLVQIKLSNWLISKLVHWTICKLPSLKFIKTSSILNSLADWVKIQYFHEPKMDVTTVFTYLYVKQLLIQLNKASYSLFHIIPGPKPVVFEREDIILRRRKIEDGSGIEY